MCWYSFDSLCYTLLLQVAAEQDDGTAKYLTPYSADVGSWRPGNYDAAVKHCADRCRRPARTTETCFLSDSRHGNIQLYGSKRKRLSKNLREEASISSRIWR